jgi:hypothetical protein
MTTNLPLVDRRDPHNAHIDGNSNDANDPEDLAVVDAVIAEDDGEDDATEISRCANYT